jgi:hypothetical protein
MNRHQIFWFNLVGLLLTAAAAHAAEESHPTAGPPTAAASQAAPPVRGTVQTSAALIDVEYLLNHHVGLTGRLVELRQEHVDFEKEAARKRARITAQRAEMKMYQMGSKEYAKCLEAVTKAQIALNVNAERKRNGFRLRETQLRLDVYRRIQEEVKEYLKPDSPTTPGRPYGSPRVNSVVLNFRRADTDAATPDGILRIIEQQVVYQNNLDITSAIRERIDPNAGRKEEYERTVEKLEALTQELAELTAEPAEQPVDEWDRLLDEWFPQQPEFDFRQHIQIEWEFLHR